MVSIKAILVLAFAAVASAQTSSARASSSRAAAAPAASSSRAASRAASASASRAASSVRLNQPGSKRTSANISLEQSRCPILHRSCQRQLRRTSPRRCRRLDVRSLNFGVHSIAEGHIENVLSTNRPYPSVLICIIWSSHNLSSCSFVHP